MKALNRILLISGALSSIFLTACSTGTVRESAYPISFSSLSVEEKSVLECDPEKPELNIKIDLRYAVDAGTSPASANINREILKTALKETESKVHFDISSDFVQTVKSYVAGEVKSYQETWTEIFRDWGHSVGSENMIAIRGNTRGMVGNAIIYQLEVDRDMGGAHPVHFKYFFNFDPVSGNRLSLSDLFKPDYEKALTDLLTRKAMTLENVSSKSKLSCEPRPTENFVLESDGILFYFNPYDIAPYSRGPVRLKLRYGELSPLMKQKNAN